MTRLIFKTDIDNNLVTKPMLFGDEKIHVKIFTKEIPFRAEIVALTYKSESVVPLEHKSLSGLKKLVKEKLKTYGIQFHDEVRPRVKNDPNII